MINEITVNSSNTIDMSRGELLNWLNDLLQTNLSKIEQLGTGAIYCQLIDVLYPKQLPLGKVNWKAKFDYEYVSNFKILQQTFNKLGILKHIEVERLIKCKYQDNLEFLQWFRKLFDNHSSNDYQPVARRGQTTDFDKKKDNKENRSNSIMVRSTSRQHTQHSAGGTAQHCQSFVCSDRADDESTIRFSAIKPITSSIPASPDFKHELEWRQEANEQAFQEERNFYLKKFKQIEHLCEQWPADRPSGDLIDQLRRIILVAPGVEWSVEGGSYSEKERKDGSEKVDGTHSEISLDNDAVTN